MRGRAWFASAALVMGVGAGGWWLSRGPAGDAPDPAVAAVAERPATRPLTAAPAAIAVTPTAGGPDAPSADSTAILSVAPGDVLAEVNGVPIRLADLMTVEPGAGEQRVNAATLTYLLERAIDRELVVQAARAAGVTLDDAQREQLAVARERLAARPPDLVADITRTPDQVALDVRDSEALMLRTNLVARAGAPSPHVTPAEVDAHYQAHRADFPPLPDEAAARRAAWKQLAADIRGQLADRQRERHAAAVAAFLRELRAGAQLVRPDLLAELR